MTIEKTGANQKPGRFKPGQSGNPAGRPRGSLNRTTLALRAIMADQAEAIVETLIGQALAGDVAAGRAILERLVPVVKEGPLDAGAVDLPSPVNAENAGQAMGIVLDAGASGSITPGQGLALIGMIEKTAKVGQQDMVRVEIQSDQPCALDPALSASISHLLPHLPEPPKS